MANKVELNGIRQSIIDKLTLNFKVGDGRVARTYSQMYQVAVKIAIIETDAELEACKESGPSESVFDYLEHLNHRIEHHMKQMFHLQELTREPIQRSESGEDTTKQEGGYTPNGTRPNIQNGSGTQEGARADGPGIPPPGRESSGACSS